MPGRTPSIPSYFLYGEPPDEAALDFVHVEPVVLRSRPHRWTIEPHRHPDLHQFLLITHGGGSMLSETDLRVFAAPALLAVPATVVHAFRWTGGTEGSVLTLASAFLDEICRRHPDLARLRDRAGCIPLGDRPAERAELSEAVAALSREIESSAPARIAAMEAHVLRVLVALARADDGDEMPAHRRREAALVARLRRFVEAAFRTHPATGEMARHLGVSASRLTAACRAVAGRSPQGVVHHRIMVEAKRRLAYSTASVAEIAEDLGFSDPAYFSRFFARHAGAAPSAFRAQARAGAGA